MRLIRDCDETPIVIYTNERMNGLRGDALMPSLSKYQGRLAWIVGRDGSAN
jgi:hypothetical protein